MKINNIKIEKLYGYIDKNIDFYSDLTLLVGINGSGKTSILNIINWLINPSLPSLCVTEFKSITLSFTLKKEDYLIKCTQNKTTFRYDISSTQKKYNPLIVKLHEHPKQIDNDQMRSGLIDLYLGLRPDDTEKETWQLISTFPNPNIIGLDRNLYTVESGNNIYYEESIKSHPSRSKAKSVITPTDRIKELVNREYRKSKDLVFNLTSSLKNQLMLSTFDGGITIENLLSGSETKLTHTQIENAESRVNDYFKKFEEQTLTDNEKNTIDLYFSQLKSITKEHHNNPNEEHIKLVYGLNANQFKKVRKILTEFENFEKKSDKAMNKIQVYLDTLNFFLKDSAKKILFKEDTSELTFSTLDKNGDVVTEYKDINHLSSGEQQVLILFSYIAFNSSDGKVFIIDEPELSLHIKWQEDFLEKLDLITPKSTQLILATHSPILANKRKAKAKTLLPYNV